MALFNIPKRPSKSTDMGIAKKSNSGSKRVATSVRGGGNLLERINAIKAIVQENLGKYADDYEIIISRQRLHEYLQKCISNKVIAIDTETTGLDPMQDKIVGLCLYTPGEKAVYVPINHISYITNQRIENQLTEQDVADELIYLIEQKPDIIMFNAKFDIRVIRNQLGLKDIYCTWDCYLATRLMNENEPTNKLKPLHKKYVLNGEGDAFSFDDLFNGICFNLIPISTAYLYAAGDSIKTYEFYEFQKRYMYYNADEPKDARNGMNGVAWVFFNIEMPCVNVVADMEDNGIELDLDYAKKLSEEYHGMLQKKIDAFYDVCNKYSDKITQYRATHENCKLSTPINIGSSSQIAILLYDILGIESQDPKNPRGTGVEILSKIDNPICSAILEYREVQKLLSTYIDKLPECVNPKDGRIHCNFNQYGADTGRFSSSDPNLQNIPSHNKDIRKMFKASDGYVLMSSDFSQQEPKTLAAMCRQNGDNQMYDTFMQGKDLYSEIASKAFNKPYEECREFNADGSTNKQGKERRTQAKSILLGVLYGRGEASIAEQLNCSVDKAKAIKQSVFKAFPAISKFEQDSLDMAYELGYVTTVCGRKRRLHALQLDEYEFKWSDGNGKSCGDILDFDGDGDDSIPIDRENFYLRKLQHCKFNEKRRIFEQANKEGIKIIDNGAKIADATRQCVNSRIQGGAADLTKLAMIKLNENERLKQLGFRLLIPVHDEVIAECPEENAQECSELLASVMSNAAEQILEMPIKCDVEITKCWYGDPLNDIVKIKESNTSHSMDVEKIRGAVNGT